jgi:ABC-type branched-subunit amino acid transport system substrate-binding protein
MYRIIFLLILVFANSVIAESKPQPVFGFLSPLSGNYAALGEDNRQGIEVALKVSQSQIHPKIIYSDSKAEPAVAMSEFRKLTSSDKASAIFVMRSPVAMAVNPLSEASEFPILGGAGDKRFAEKNKYAFQIWSKSDEEGEFLANVFKSKNYDTAAIVTTEDDWTSSVTAGFVSKYKDSGSLVINESVLPADNDFRTILLRAKKLSPKVIFANLGLAQIGPFIRQAREINLPIPIYSNFWAAKKDVLESVGEAALEGVRFVEMDTNYPVLRKELSTIYGTTPSGATLTAYISTLLMIQAASTLKGDVNNPKEIYESLLKQTVINTPDGDLSIKDRCVNFPLVQKVIKGGKAVTE